MNEKLEEIFIKQMLLPKEELAMQTMELLADKMELQSKIDKVIEFIDNYEIKENIDHDIYMTLLEIKDILKEDK